MRFSVVNLGCKVNRVEADAFERMLMSRGFASALEGGADIVVVNTCTVTAVAEKKTRKAVRQSLKANPGAKVIVTGCAAVQSPSVYEAMSERVTVVPKWDMDEHLSGILPDPTNEATIAQAVSSFLSLGRARVGVKVQDGCRNECTYCIVHKVRGPETSVPVADVLRQAKEAEAMGAGEVVLSGINLGRYSHRGMGLSELVESLLAEGLRCRIRLSSIEPDDVDDDLLSIVASAEGRVCRHFHLPLQSGSDKVLGEMGRKYTSYMFSDLVGRIRELMPQASISTDVIAGFPGETEEEFEETAKLCRECGFSKMHVFPYSEREGTPAAERDDQVPHEVRLSRAEELRRLGDSLREADRAARAGISELAVVEDEVWCTTESYHSAHAPSGAVPGSLVGVTL